MACPYFMPIAKLDGGAWPHPARLPLGCGWSGHCTAPGHEQSVPVPDVLESLCNLGYASRCSWAPEQRSADAVRFAVAAPGRDSQGKPPEAPAPTLRLTYVYENNNRPAGQGELMYDLSRTVWIQRHTDARIQRMAECFLESYLSRKV